MRKWPLAAAAALLLHQAALACETSADSSRIAVAGGSLTEIIFFLGAEARIVAVDSTSTFPQAAGAFPSVGYVRALSAEGLLSLKPTLVLGEDDMGPGAVLEQVARANVDVVRVPENHTAAGILDKVRCVAAILDLGAQGEALIRTQLDPMVAALESMRVPTPRQPQAVLLLQISAGAPTAAGRGTSGDGFLRMASARNAFADFAGWKPVSPEAMASARPDYVVITERVTRDGGGTDQLLANPAMMAALQDRREKAERLIAMDGMAMLGFAPRTLEAALQLARRIHAPSLKGTERDE